MIDVKDLEAFLAIRDCGSISRAAEQLGITQPALSLKLKKMELALGVPLFQRTSRSMVALETCGSIEPLARDILIKIAALKEALAQRIDELEGQVRIAFLIGWTDSLLVPVIDKMRAECPRISLKLQIMETIPALEAVAEGRLDLAIVAKPFEEPDGVTSAHLVDEQLVLFARELPPHGDDRGALREALLAMQWVSMTPQDLLVSQYWRGAFDEEFPWHLTAPPIVVDHLFAVRSIVARIPGTVAALPSQVLRFSTESHSPFDRRLLFPQKNPLHLAWRHDGLELRRFRVTRDVIQSAAKAFDPLSLV